MRYKGIDVSEIHGKIDWKYIESKKISFAIVRATYDSSGIDAQFEFNISGISKTKIYPGAYHESSAGSVFEAQNEALHFLKIIRPYRFCYPLALKYENEFAVSVGKNYVTNIILAFLDVVRSHNYFPILYADKNWLEKFLDINKMNCTDFWIYCPARHNLNPIYEKNVTIRQHLKNGKIFGSDINANLNISYINYHLLLLEKGLNNLNMDPKKNNFANQKSNLCEPVFYTVKKGDTLRGISQTFFNDPEQYIRIAKLNGITNTVIYPGQILRIPLCKDDKIVLHRVKTGETLWKLAERYLGYGPKYSEIMYLNGLTSDMIYPGQILKIPQNEFSTSSYESTYKVKPGDTLWKIAEENLGDGNRYAEIMSLNNLKDGNIRVGQILKMPSQAKNLYS